MSWWHAAKDAADEVLKHTDNGVGIGAASYVAGVTTSAAATKGAKAVGSGARKIASIPSTVKDNKKIEKENRGAERDVPGDGDREIQEKKKWWKS